MDSLADSRRQLRIALIAIAIVIPLGIFGFMVIEKFSFLDALWTTIITISTIGYGDIYAETSVGRVFTILLVIFGLSTFAYGLQAVFSFFVSQEVRDLRRVRQTERKIAKLRGHYIICGEGELVDKTIGYLLDLSEMRREHQDQQILGRVNANLGHYFGANETGIRAWIKKVVSRIEMLFLRILNPGETLLDLIVVITTDHSYAQHLRSENLLVVEGDATNHETLLNAGLEHAQAIVVMLGSDTQTLLTVLTANSSIDRMEDHEHADIYITAATFGDDMNEKMLRVGADNVIAPFDVAGQFLNNATLRPAVNDFFNHILFNEKTSEQIVQLFIYADSPWLGKRIGQLELHEKHHTGIIGLREADGTYLYAPNADYILTEGDILLAVTPGPYIPPLQEACRPGKSTRPVINKWRHEIFDDAPQKSEQTYSLMEAEEAIKQMSQHFVICGNDRVINNSIRKLSPDRPFVIISNSNEMTSRLLKLGFRVIHGDPTQEETLLKAGVDRALALMVSITQNADSVLTILNARLLSSTLLITATAPTDEMLPKLHQAGADRVVSPFRIAAQFVLLATTRPAVSDFMQHVIFNYHSGLETTELYMQDNSPWIGKSLEELLLERIFRAGILGIRQANGQYIYSPQGTYVIKENDILIITVPMINSDELRSIAHGTENKLPTTLRRKSILRNY
ncbi:MAG: NAD-binding protein [Aggregatilineales bacterium]